jgi:hypothetical protein
VKDFIKKLEDEQQKINRILFMIQLRKSKKIKALEERLSKNIKLLNDYYEKENKRTNIPNIRDRNNGQGPKDG